MTCTTGIDKVKGGYYILRHIDGRRGAAVGGGCGRLYAGEVPRHSITRLCANPEDDIVYALECDEKINYVEINYV